MTLTRWNGPEEGVKGTKENSRRARYLIKQRPHCTHFKITFTEAWKLAYWSEEESLIAVTGCGFAIVIANDFNKNSCIVIVFYS